MGGNEGSDREMKGNLIRSSQEIARMENIIRNTEEAVSGQQCIRG